MHDELNRRLRHVLDANRNAVTVSVGSWEFFYVVSRGPDPCMVVYEPDDQGRARLVYSSAWRGRYSNEYDFGRLSRLLDDLRRYMVLEDLAHV